MRQYLVFGNLKNLPKENPPENYDVKMLEEFLDDLLFGPTFEFKAKSKKENKKESEPKEVKQEPKEQKSSVVSCGLCNFTIYTKQLFQYDEDLLKEDWITFSHKGKKITLCPKCSIQKIFLPLWRNTDKEIKKLFRANAFDGSAEDKPEDKKPI